MRYWITGDVFKTVIAEFGVDRVRREHPVMRQRRESRVNSNPTIQRSNYELPSAHHSRSNTHRSNHDMPATHHSRSNTHRSYQEAGGENDLHPTNDRTPLLAGIFSHNESSPRRSAFGLFGVPGRHGSRNRRNSNASSVSSRRRQGVSSRHNSTAGLYPTHDVNNPPSMPGSPRLGGLDIAYDDVLVSASFESNSPDDRRGDQLINIDEEEQARPQIKRQASMEGRRHQVALSAEEDVCFPIEGTSAFGDEDYHEQDQEAHLQPGQRRRRIRHWPDLSVLEEWMREEKEERSEGIRAKKISEPVLVGGRLRPQQQGWHREEEDAPYRFTYFNEELPSTIHSQTISELLQPGQDYRELFIPDPPELSDCSSSEDEHVTSPPATVTDRQDLSPSHQSRMGTRQSSILGSMKAGTASNSGEGTPSQSLGPNQTTEKPKKYGERPTFWLDVLSPTDAEMRVIAKAFAIHPLTAEDIMMQEAREKVELFRNYYFVNYRTFEQDTNSEDFLEPVNMYAVVFPEAVISFHFSMTPHPANVRRRIRQLRDYIKVSSDWISYALIDDITDVFAPLITSIEEEVDDIDDAILRLHSGEDPNSSSNSCSNNEKSNQASKGINYFNQHRNSGHSHPHSDDGGGGNNNNSDGSKSGGDMLRRVGEARKKVMLLYRLLGNKADVIKGFAKRCNEKWDIAPRSDIGLYLGDIQDHLMTMTSNLNHYETLLSRAHSNYLAQINIAMNERQEQTADVLGKLTVLGTIVLPMNIITGMWGMNVLVPGQNAGNLWWFWSITAFLFVFGISCFFIAKRVYGIV